MATLEQLSDLNNQAAEVIASEHFALDRFAAELLLRNLAGAVDLLSPGEVDELSPETLDDLWVVAHFAKRFTKPGEADDELLPGETYNHYRYRITIWQSLQRFPGMIAMGQAGLPDSDVRDAVWSAGRAFGGIVRDVPDNVKIQQAEPLFRRYTEKAVERLSFGPAL